MSNQLTFESKQAFWCQNKPISGQNNPSSLQMFEEKLLVGVATAASTMAVVAVLIVIPSLYQEIVDVHNDVIDGVSVSVRWLRLL